MVERLGRTANEQWLQRLFCFVPLPEPIVRQALRPPGRTSLGDGSGDAFREVELKLLARLQIDRRLRRKLDRQLDSTCPRGAILPTDGPAIGPTR
jgi:hypothetical protein